MPRALHRAKERVRLFTDVWVRPQGGLAWFPHRRFVERFQPELSELGVRAWSFSLLVFEVRCRLRNVRGWTQILRRNRWFQDKVVRDLHRRPGLVGERRPILFAYSYAAREILRFAKAQGWTTVLGQIDPGPGEEDKVKELHRRWPEFHATWQPAPAEYWSCWREECELADVILVNSEWSLEALVARGVNPRKTRVIPLAYEDSGTRPSFSRSYPARFTPQRPLRVLFLGQIILRKGMAEVLAALRELRNLPMEFWFVGPVQVRVPPELRADPRLQWIGAVPRSQVAAYYQQADVFLFPSHSDGFGLTQLEAQAWRLPILSSRFCGEVVRSGVNGLVLEEVTPDRIAQALRYLLDNPGILEEMSLRSRSLEEYGLANLGRKLTAVVSD